jgi:hypothetical protein
VTRIGGGFGPSPKPEPPRRSKRRDDARWRHGCLAMRGWYCRVCAMPPAPNRPGPLEIDHIWPRSQGGPSVVENGLVLCRRHHADKTAGVLRIDRRWLDADQVAWLADVGWVEWDGDGSPLGRGWRHFERVVAHGEGGRLG